MKRIRFALPIALALWLALPHADAAEKGGVTMPDQQSVAGKTLVLNGMGVREATVLMVDVYVGGLYLESRSTDAQWVIDSRTVKRIVMHFVRDVEREKIVETWTDGFRKNAGANFESLKARLDVLNGWTTNIAKGQVVTLTYIPGKGIEVRSNGALKGTIEGDDFARVMFRIFFGPNPPNTGLKEGMLGKQS